jgi:AmmeMemoRadiSam system protein B
MTGRVRKPAVAGRWYPQRPDELVAEVDRYLSAANEAAAFTRVLALIAPHAGLMYSGPVAAYGYRLLREIAPEVVVLVGPSHFIGFEGVSIYCGAAFDTPLGQASLDATMSEAFLQSPLVRDLPGPHEREHSLEMQLPFVRRVAPEATIVPLLMGYQTSDVSRQLGDVLASVVRGRRAVMVASSDLSHYHDSDTASRLDRVVLECVERFDAEQLQRALDTRPEHACGGGPMVAVMRAATLLGATAGAVLHYADSGDVSGDKTSVVGYMAAAFGSRSGVGSSGS